MSVLNFLRELPQRLTRVTSGGKMIREVDGLRFLAIAPVVIQHLSERLERNAAEVFRPGVEFDSAMFMMHRGSVGVFLFFMISGFILGMPFASHYLHGTKPISLKSYYWRRVTRLEPPYIVVLIGITLYLIIIAGQSAKEIIPHFLASVVYLHSIIFWDWSPINPPIWTLEIEVQFYVLAPILAWLFFSVADRRTRRMGMVGGLAIIMILQQYFSTFTGNTSWTILGHLHYFLIGFFLVDLYLTDWKDGITKHPIFNVTGVLAFAGLFLTWSWDFEWYSRVAFVVSLFLLGYSAFRSTWVNKFLTLPWITAIGGMCYTIYLIHLPIIEALIKFTSKVYWTDIFTVNVALQGLILVPIVLIFSMVFFLLIEKPCMYKDWPARLRQWITQR